MIGREKKTFYEKQDLEIPSMQPLRVLYLLGGLRVSWDFPSLAKRGHLPARSRFGEGRGEIFGNMSFDNGPIIVTGKGLKISQGLILLEKGEKL